MKVTPRSSARRTTLAASSVLAPLAIPSRLAPPQPSPATLTSAPVRPSSTVCNRSLLKPARTIDGPGQDPPARGRRKRRGKRSLIISRHGCEVYAGGTAGGDVAGSGCKRRSARPCRVVRRNRSVAAPVRGVQPQRAKPPGACGRAAGRLCGAAARPDGLPLVLGRRRRDAGGVADRKACRRRNRRRGAPGGRAGALPGHPALELRLRRLVRRPVA